MGVCDCTLTTANAMRKIQVLIAGNKTGNEGHTAQDIADWADVKAGLIAAVK